MAEIAEKKKLTLKEKRQLTNKHKTAGQPRAFTEDEFIVEETPDDYDEDAAMYANRADMYGRQDEQFVWKTAAEIAAEISLPTAFRQFFQA